MWRAIAGRILFSSVSASGMCSHLSNLVLPCLLYCVFCTKAACCELETCALVQYHEGQFDGREEICRQDETCLPGSMRAVSREGSMKAPSGFVDGRWAAGTWSCAAGLSPSPLATGSSTFTIRSGQVKSGADKSTETMYNQTQQVSN